MSAGMLIAGLPEQAYSDFDLAYILHALMEKGFLDVGTEK
jgi:hypothetical protein